MFAQASPSPVTVPALSGYIMSLLHRTTLQISRDFDGRGALWAETHKDGPPGDRKVRCNIRLKPEDGHIAVVLSTEVRGPKATWERGDRHLSLSVGETCASGVMETTLLIGRSVMSEADEALLRGEGDARNRTVGFGGDGGHVAEVAGETPRLN